MIKTKRSLYGDVDYADVFIWFVSFGVNFDIGDPLHHLHAFSTPSKHCVLVVEPRLWGGGTKDRYMNITFVTLLCFCSAVNEKYFLFSCLSDHF